MKIVRCRPRFMTMPMNAMCDIAFLLFIFILVMSAVNIKAPEDFNPAESDEAVQQKQPDIEIFISEDGGLFLDGHRVSLEYFSDTVRQNMAADCGLCVGISAHRDCEFSKVQEITAMLEKLDCTDVVLILKKN